MSFRLAAVLLSLCAATLGATECADAPAGFRYCLAPLPAEPSLDALEEIGAKLFASAQHAGQRILVVYFASDDVTHRALLSCFPDELRFEDFLESRLTWDRSSKSAGRALFDLHGHRIDLRVEHQRPQRRIHGPDPLSRGLGGDVEVLHYLATAPPAHPEGQLTAYLCSQAPLSETRLIALWQLLSARFAPTPVILRWRLDPWWASLMFPAFLPFAPPSNVHDKASYDRVPEVSLHRENGALVFGHSTARRH